MGHPRSTCAYSAMPDRTVSTSSSLNQVQVGGRWCTWRSSGLMSSSVSPRRLLVRSYMRGSGDMPTEGVSRGVAGCGAKLAPTAGEKSQRTRPARNYCDNPALGVDPPSPRTSAPPSGLAGPKSASGDPQTRPKRPCGGRTGRRVGARCTARPDLPAKTPPVGRSGLAVHVGPRGAAPRAAAPSRDALLGVFTFKKALSKITGGGGGLGRARPWVI